MKLTSKTIKKSSIAVISPVLFLGVAACGNDSDKDATSTETVTAGQSTVVESAEDSTASDSTASATASNTASLNAPELKVNGNQVDTSAFAPIACVRGKDDGRQELEYKAGDDRAPGKLEVDLALEPLALTSFELKHDGKEYEMDDAEKAQAKVTEGDKSYTITGTAHQDDGQGTIDVKLTVGC
ncbi:lipoprotein LpqH [Corynebacterium falsenii]|uniref:lipoprotein LpqH n=1 Tax=Corynebacterium falsenii TaxID=108486 RepID=UPI001CCDE59A|nr:lipoprotein LpqH [Corynebacterium falsenii]UBI06573.1 lipoprotein LpqH [Corynebacterium falsenii]